MIDASRNGEVKHQLRLYGWQLNKLGVYKVRQKFNISRSSYIGLLIFVLSQFIASDTDLSNMKGGRDLVDKLLSENKNLNARLIKAAKSIILSSNLKDKELKIKKLEKMLGGIIKSNEKNIQLFLKENFWMLGTEYISVADEEWLATGGRLDFLAQKINGYFDIVELKLPSEMLFVGKKGKESMSGNLKDAVSQMARYRNHYDKNYLFETSKHDSERRDVLYPIGVIIIGRSTTEQKSILEYHRNIFDRRLNILTYDDIVQKAKQIIKNIKQDRKKVVKIK
ncbi:MAG: DUF4263 domain-containing protein [Candidatus Levybacteria bacterium]|nr:DUF4263 domain-containing protein [Candidatus Levybacteria bacterium]